MCFKGENKNFNEVLLKAKELGYAETNPSADLNGDDVSSKLKILDKKLYDELKIHYNIAYDEKDAVGRRYRRQDAIGTPICLTVDHDSIKDDTVTLRFRDSMDQIRVNIADIKSEIDNKISLHHWLV